MSASPPRRSSARSTGDGRSRLRSTPLRALVALAVFTSTFSACNSLFGITDGLTFVEGGVVQADASTDADSDAEARLCLVVAEGEDIRGPLAPAGSALLYWANGTSNSIRMFDGIKVSDVLINDAAADAGVVSAVAVADDAIVWSADRGGRSGGLLHVDSFTQGIGKGPVLA